VGISTLLHRQHMAPPLCGIQEHSVSVSSNNRLHQYHRHHHRYQNLFAGVNRKRARHCASPSRHLWMSSCLLMPVTQGESTLCGSSTFSGMSLTPSSSYQTVDCYPGSSWDHSSCSDSLCSCIKERFDACQVRQVRFVHVVTVHNLDVRDEDRRAHRCRFHRRIQ